MDVQVPPGIAEWIVVDYEPGGVQEWHHTDTVDFDLVLQGSIDLTLDDGVHHLDAGDGAVINGVDHAWQAGARGLPAERAVPRDLPALARRTHRSAVPCCAGARRRRGDDSRNASDP